MGCKTNYEPVLVADGLLSGLLLILNEHRSSCRCTGTLAQQVRSGKEFGVFLSCLVELESKSLQIPMIRQFQLVDLSRS